MFKVNSEDTRKTSVRWLWLLTLNYFTSFPMVDFEQVNILLKKLSDIYSFDICFSVSVGARQGLTQSNAGNSVMFLISETE